VSDVSGMSKAGETEMGGMLEVAVAVGGGQEGWTQQEQWSEGRRCGRGRATRGAEGGREAGAVDGGKLGVVGFKLCREAYDL